MEESLGPELKNLLIEAYVSCVLEEFDELWLRTLYRLAALHAMEVEDSDSEEEEEFQEFLELRMLLVQVSLNHGRQYQAIAALGHHEPSRTDLAELIPNGSLNCDQFMWSPVSLLAS